MASEALTKFTEVFNKQFDAQIAKTKERITKNEAKVKEHQEIHAQILKYLESNKLITKEEFLKIFPAEGGENIMINVVSGVVDPAYITLVNGFRDEEDKDLKKLPDRLYKLANAPSRLAFSKTQLQNEEKLKADGPEKLVSLFYSAIIQQTFAGGGVDPFLKKALGTKQNPIEYDGKSWEDTVSAITRDIIKFDYIPAGVLTGVSLFNLMQEKYFSGELGQKSEAKASPINASEAGEEKTKSKSPINQPAGEGPDKKEKSASITQTDEVKKETEPESKIESKPEAINEPKPEEKPEEVVKLKPEIGEKAPVSEKKANIEVINFGEKELAALDKAEKEEKQKQAKISSIVENLKVDESKKSEIADILSRFSESRGKTSTETSSKSLIESFEKSKDLAQSLQKIGGAPPAINQTTLTSAAASTVADFINVQSTSSAQTINQVDQSKTSTFSSPTTNLSSPKVLTEAQQNIINEYKQKLGIFTPEENKIRADLEKSIKIESGSTGSIDIGETTVEKGKTSFAEKIPANTQNAFTSTQNTQNLNQTIKQPEKEITSVKTEVVSPPTQQVDFSPTESQPMMTMDLSVLEKRLRNLEEILSSPLSVKVV